MRIPVSMAAARKAIENDLNHPESAGSPSLRLSNRVTPIQMDTNETRVSGMSIQGESPAGPVRLLPFLLPIGIHCQIGQAHRRHREPGAASAG
jgi:hypothetical protein